MINFRFHIVSLTAVLLALGVGLVLGTTFLDNATVDVLRRQLDDLEVDVANARQRNEELSQRLGRYEDEAEGLEEQLGERLYVDLLEDAPVLVVSSRGVDEALVEAVTTSLDEAGADLVGTWWLTGKLALEDDGQVADLGDALELGTDDVDRLLRRLSVQLADVLSGAVEPVDDPSVGGAVTAGPPSAPAEPDVLAALRDGGFVEYDVPEDDGGDVVRLPRGGLRVVVVSGPAAAVSPGQVLLPVLSELASEAPVPVVVTEPSPPPPGGDDETEEPPALLVPMIRDADELAQRISTVDDLDRVPGRVATVLATVDAAPGDPVIGHYGDAKGTRLLPPPPEGG